MDSSINVLGTDWPFEKNIYLTLKKNSRPALLDMVALATHGYLNLN